MNLARCYYLNARSLSWSVALVLATGSGVVWAQGPAPSKRLPDKVTKRLPDKVMTETPKAIEATIEATVEPKALEVAQEADDDISQEALDAKAIESGAALAESKAPSKLSIATEAFGVGDYERALANYRLAYAEDPIAGILYNIAMCQHHLGDVPGAVASMEAFLQLAPANAARRPEAVQYLLLAKRGQYQLPVASRPAPPPEPSLEPPRRIPAPAPAPAAAPPAQAVAAPAHAAAAQPPPEPPAQAAAPAPAAAPPAHAVARAPVGPPPPEPALETEVERRVTTITVAGGPVARMPGAVVLNPALQPNIAPWQQLPPPRVNRAMAHRGWIIAGVAAAIIIVGTATFFALPSPGYYSHHGSHRHRHYQPVPTWYGRGGFGFNGWGGGFSFP